MKRFVLLIIAAGLLLPMAAQENYTERDVTIKRTDSRGRKVELAGTLTIPKGERPAAGWPAMVLVTGSGSQNRDEELMGHKPFRVIAEYMAGQGVAVLRCDDRGVGGSTGAYNDITIHDLADDAEAEWKWLRKQRGIDKRRVGLLGHSEGGTIAPMVASRDENVAFVVMLAGAGRDGRQVLIEQNMAIFTLRGVADSIVGRRLAYLRDVFDASDSVMKAADGDTTDIVKRLNLTFRPLMHKHSKGLTLEQRKAAGLVGSECYELAIVMTIPWMRTFLHLDPTEYLAKVRCPVLALNGTLDCQVVSGTNLSAIMRVCEANKVDCTTVALIGLNHMFQECKTGAVEEYATAGQSPDNKVLENIVQWLREKSIIL